MGTPRLSSDSESETSDSEGGSTDLEDNSDHDATANSSRSYHPWRTQPNPESFSPLIRSVAAAISRMPALQTGDMELGSEDHPPVILVLKFAAVGCAFQDRSDY